MSTGQSESCSNGRLAKGFHPRNMCDHVVRLLDFVFFFDILGIVSTGQSESRSNGGPAKDFHPQLVWDHVMWFLDFVFFLIFYA